MCEKESKNKVSESQRAKEIVNVDDLVCLFKTLQCTQLHKICRYALQDNELLH